jgi:hypothetical protein
MKDVAGNLNKGNKGNRYSENTKAFSQAMKVYGGCRMCDFFAFNFPGPNYKTIKKEKKKACNLFLENILKYLQLLHKYIRMPKRNKGLQGLFLWFSPRMRQRSRVGLVGRPNGTPSQGFVVPKLICSTKFKPVVGDGEEG